MRNKIYLCIANRIDGARLVTPALRKWWWRLCRLLRPTGTIPIPLAFGRLWADSRDGVAAYQLMKRSTWEPRETEVLLAEIHPGQHIVEVGANIGYHTIQLAQGLGANGQIHAFEPAPTNRAILFRNVAEHRLAISSMFTPRRCRTTQARRHVASSAQYGRAFPHLGQCRRCDRDCSRRDHDAGRHPRA